jgi:hypothetical protein
MAINLRDKKKETLETVKNAGDSMAAVTKGIQGVADLFGGDPAGAPVGGMGGFSPQIQSEQDPGAFQRRLAGPAPQMQQAQVQQAQVAKTAADSAMKRRAVMPYGN